ncbi:MAG: DUF167 domain-containing protein [Planctomycetota bacterium]|nr:DUF167 domain-containing protein [Planctomycetota bacterium]
MSAQENTLDESCVRALDGGRATSLSVRAQPGSRRSGLIGFWNGTPKIAVTAPPENGRANEEIAREIAAVFGLRPAAVTQVGGAKSRAKTFRLECAPDRVLARLREWRADIAKPGAPNLDERNIADERGQAP